MLINIIIKRNNIVIAPTKIIFIRNANTLNPILYIINEVKNIINEIEKIQAIFELVNIEKNNVINITIIMIILKFSNNI
tara:strand:- start:8195 stop:8431 length:237 start_codon:yes stop_codon:yes gene_type:complete